MKAKGYRGPLALLWAGQFLVTAGLTVIVPLLPFYMEELGAGDKSANLYWSGLALAAPALPLVFASPLWGRLGDRCGRKWMVVRALFGISASVVLMGYATSPLQFLICRLLQGAFGGMDDAAAAFAGTHFPEGKLGKAMGFLQTATAAGALVGPLCGGFLSRIWGFPPLVISIGILIGLCGTTAAFLLREKRDPKREEPPRAGTGSGESRSTLGSAILDTLRDRSILRFILAGLSVQIGAYGLMNVFASHVRDLSSGESAAYAWVGLLQSATWGMTLLGAAWWGRRNDRTSSDRNFVLAASGCALGIGLQIIPTQVAWLFPLRMFQGFCHSALGQTVFLKVCRNVPKNQQGLRIGLSNSFLTLGQVLGALLGSVLGAAWPARAVFLTMALFFALGGALVWANGSRCHNNHKEQ